MVGYICLFIVIWHICDIHLCNFNLFLYLNTFKKNIVVYINMKSIFILLVIYNYCCISYLFIILLIHCNEAQDKTEIPNEHPAPCSEQAPYCLYL